LSDGRLVANATISRTARGRRVFSQKSIDERTRPSGQHSPEMIEVSLDVTPGA
jgi:hypothetical protein